MHVLIQQNEYRCIDMLMCHCLLINELVFAMNKTLKLTFTENRHVINPVQYGDSHGFVPEEIILSVSARASNTFKQ